MRPPKTLKYVKWLNMLNYSCFYKDKIPYAVNVWNNYAIMLRFVERFFTNQFECDACKYPFNVGSLEHPPTHVVVTSRVYFPNICLNR